MKINKMFKVLCTLWVCSLSCAHAQHVYSLEELKQCARSNNHTLAISRRNVEIAKQQRNEAFTKYFPSISATGLTFNANKDMAAISVNPGEVIPASLAQSLAQNLSVEGLGTLSSPVELTMMKKGTLAGVTLMQPVFAGGQIVNANRLARIGEDVNRLQLKLSENEIDLTTEQYYWQLIALQQKYATLISTESLLDDIHKDVDASVRAGIALRNDLLQVQLRQNEVQSQRLKLNHGVSVMKLLLCQHCGLNDTVFNIMTPDFAANPIEAVQPSKALPALAEYQMLNKNVEAATLNKKIAIGKNLPTVAVGAGYNYYHMMGKNRSFAMVFATVSIPISDWWGGSHSIKRKELEQQNAVEQFADKSELLVVRMQQLWNEVEEAYQQIDIANKSIQQASENLRLNRDCYNAGTSKMSDLLEAQMLYRQALDSRTDAWVIYQVKVSQYRQATAQY